MSGERGVRWGLLRRLGRLATTLVVALVAALGACGGPARGDRPLADTAAYREPRALVSSGRFMPAAAAYARIRDSFAARRDTANQWFGQLWWTESMVRGGRPDSSAVGLVLSRALAGTDPRRLGWVAVIESHALERRGQLDSAVTAAEEAIEAYRRSGDRELGVFAYDALGTPLSRRGRYREALLADSTSLALRLAIPMSQRVIAGGWNEVAIGYRHLARFDEAEAALRQSFRLAEEQHDTLAMALALGNLSSVLDDTGDKDGAVAALTQGSEYVEAIQHQRFMAEFHSELGVLLLDSGQPDAAVDHAVRALAGGRKMANRSVEIRALMVLGGIELARHHLAAARDTIGRMLALADRLGFGAERVAARIQLVDAAVEAKDPATARRIADAALTIADSLGDPSIQFNALEARARALEAGGSADATAAYGAALALLESMRGRLALGDLRMGVAAPRLSAYEGAIRTFIAAGRPLEALSTAERARARMLLELMADRGVMLPGSEQHAIGQRIREAYDTRERVSDSAGLARLDREIGALGDSLARLESAQPLPAGRVASPDELRGALLGRPGGRALLAYFWGEKQVFGWWITGDSARAVVLGGADSLAAVVDFLSGALARPAGDTLWRAAARRAYARFVAPLRPDAGSGLLVVLDGPLHRIPAEVILSGNPAGYDAARLVSYGPSASVLAALVRTPPGRWGRAMLAVGNPTLSNPDSALGQGALPFAEREARAVRDLFRADGAELLVGRKATVARWLDLSPGRYRYLHFALHARASDRRQEQSALLFAGKALSVPEIRRLHLNAELVTLSACETAVGQWVRGEGVVGMQYAFLAAGARSALVTLWKVPDQAAADFIQAFYAELKAGLPAATALARVRARWIAAGGERAHPSRWAAFILVGA